jgi:hypothetical protein
MYISSYRLKTMANVQRLLDQLQPEAVACALCMPGTKTPRGNIIIFTGSFNPPTNAHLALLKQGQVYADQHADMHLYTAFSKRTVDKEGLERPLLLDRALLLHTILQKRLPHAGMLLFNRGLYLEQAQAIRNSFPRVKRILFLMGYDKIVQIFDPRYYEDRDAALDALFSLAELLVVPRGNGGKQEMQELLQRPENRRYARYVIIHSFNPIYREISATRVRQGGFEAGNDTMQEVRRFMRYTRAYAPALQRRGRREIDYYRQRVQYLRDHIGHVS